MITKIFWTVAILDGIAAFVLWKLFRPGMGTGLLVLAYLVVVAAIVITACIFPLLRSDGLRIAALIFLLLPSVPLLFSSVTQAVTTVQSQRDFGGSAYFEGPALDLAQAIVQHDVALVKQLIPAAGDLNQPHGRGVTLWQWGVLRRDGTEASFDILRALLAAGADPKRDTSPDTLQVAIVSGPRLTQFLLEAGSNPNVLDLDHRPVWWGTMNQGEDDESTELLRMMLDHGADLSLGTPNGRGPVEQAVYDRHWYDACLLIERGAEWKQVKLRGSSVPQLLEWEIIRRDDYPAKVPEKLRKVLADMKGEPMVIPVARARAAGDIRISDVLRDTTFDKLDQTRAALSRLSRQPDWVSRVVAFFEEGDGTQVDHVALLLSLKPEALPEDVQERCWNELRKQVALYDRSAAAYPNERKGWLLKETAVIAVGLASIPGPVRERHRADFTALRDRIEQCRKAKDPDASHLADLKKADWMAG
jgi:hypothetical protein